LVLEERINGLNKIRIKRWDKSADYYLPFDEETYSAGVYSNPEFDTDIIRYGYQSFTTPSSVIDFNMSDKSKEIKKNKKYLVESLIKTIIKVKEFGLLPGMVKKLRYH